MIYNNVNYTSLRLCFLYFSVHTTAVGQKIHKFCISNLWDREQVGKGPLTEDLRCFGVHGDDLIAHVLQVGGNGVTGFVAIRGETDDRDDSIVLKDRSDLIGRIVAAGEFAFEIIRHGTAPCL